MRCANWSLNYEISECFQYLVTEEMSCYSIWSRIRNAHYLRDISNTHVTDTSVHIYQMLRLTIFLVSKN